MSIEGRSLTVAARKRISVRERYQLPSRDRQGAVVRKGSALLAVLWLSAALAAIVFSVAHTVRGETERTATAVEGARAYYLAAGSIERAILHVQWGPGLRNPDGSPRFYEPGMPYRRFSYPGGEVLVEFIPESSKLNLNQAKPEELHRLLMALGTEPERAYQLVQAIQDWRTPAPPGGLGPLDSFYLSRTPSFPARHASFEEIEEVLLVQGMTPELFYVGYDRDAQGRLAPRPGLRDCISVYGSTVGFDVNTAEPAVMMAAGVAPDVARTIAEARRRTPFRGMEQVQALLGGAAPGLNRLNFGASTILTLRATARPRVGGGQLSDLRRTVAALVKFLGPGWDPPVVVLRWYDNAPALAGSF
ncbi:MAG: general secretion pathway protein GspK [Acidobacteria bacterium]|nr:general secretion pathway protein GspK [Acidobacteriota bacterium]